MQERRNSSALAILYYPIDIEKKAAMYNSHGSVNICSTITMKYVHT